MEFHIHNSYLTVTVSSLGAEVTSLTYNSEERLWQNENNTWNRHAPILFPHAGKCSVIIDGKRYPDEFHGFLRDQEFSLVRKSSKKLILEFVANEKSLNSFPFKFKFRAIFKVHNNALIISYKVYNLDSREMYFFLGNHESFKLHSSPKNYKLVFPHDETFDSLEASTHKITKLGNGRILSLNTELLDNGNTIILHNLNSRSVILKNEKDDEVAAYAFPDFPNLLLWHSVGSDMICIEPWLNLPDTKEDDKKELKDKEHVVVLQPKNSRKFTKYLYYFNSL